MHVCAESGYTVSWKLLQKVLHEVLQYFSCSVLSTILQYISHKVLLLLIQYILLGRIAVLRIDAAFLYRPSSVVCLSVSLSRSWAQQIRLNRSRCRLGCRLGWAEPSKEACVRLVHNGAAWRMWLNCPCAAAMRLYVKLLFTTCYLLVLRTTQTTLFPFKIQN